MTTAIGARCAWRWERAIKRACCCNEAVVVVVVVVEEEVDVGSDCSVFTAGSCSMGEALCCCMIASSPPSSFLSFSAND